jgi:hypothetical protein
MGAFESQDLISFHLKNGSPIPHSKKWTLASHCRFLRMCQIIFTKDLVVFYLQLTLVGWQVTAFNPLDGKQAATVVDNKFLVWDVGQDSAQLVSVGTMQAKGTLQNQ